jgi:RNA polymerase sigma factor (sigma-70 family)
MGKKYDLDLSKMEDEALVVLAQECGFRPAADEVVLRYHEPMGRLIAQKARQTSLTEADLQDAQQNSFFALLEAIVRYNTLEMAKPGGCRFRSYLHLVTVARFRDFVKQVCRVQNRYSCSAWMDEAEVAGPCSDPAEAAARLEALGRLNKSLDGLGENLRVLWHELAAGKSLRQIARDWGVSYDALKRLRRKLLKQIGTQLP